MTPEQFYHLSKLKDINSIYEMRVKSLDWMLGCYIKGTIRRRTIINLIPLAQLYDLQDYMLERERYEDCAVIRDVIETIYEQTKLIDTMSKKRVKEIIGLLENTIQKEQQKTGGGNQELIDKLTIKLENLYDWKPKNK